MVKLRKRLDTIEALNDAIDGYHHLPVDVLSQFLLDNYTVDLDILAKFAEQLEYSGAPIDGTYRYNSERRAQPAA